LHFLLPERYEGLSMAEPKEGFVQGNLAKRFRRFFLPSVPSVQNVRWIVTILPNQHKLHTVEKTYLMGIERWNLHSSIPFGEKDADKRQACEC